MVLLDTNAVLRFVLKDISSQHKEIVNFLTKNQSLVRLEVLVEMIYVLEKYYKKSRVEIAHIVFILGKTENLLFQYPRVITRALHFFIDEGMDIVDCILCAFNVVMGHEVFSFDKDMNALLRSFTKQAPP